MTKCKIEGCNGKVIGRGYCPKHYYRFMKYGDPLKAPQVYASDEERFWSKVDRKGEDECWNWTAKSKLKGYGYFSRGGRKGRHELAHRVSWEYANGQIPESEDYHGHVIMHTCDNRLCCNPNHLKLGTQSENVKDMDQKGRRKTKALKGEAHANSRFTEKDILYIRNSGKVTKELCKEFNCGRGTINTIKRGTTWKHLL